MPKRAFRFALVAAALFVPGHAGHAADAPTKADSFAESFAPLSDLPSPQINQGTVDLTTIEVPRDSRAAATALGRGVASYYADAFNGRRTASGETFSNAAMTAAHRSLPFGTRLRVTNPSTGASVIVRINDRGPFHSGRSLDVSRAAAQKLGLIARGSGTVEMERLD